MQISQPPSPAFPDTRREPSSRASLDIPAGADAFRAMLESVRISDHSPLSEADRSEIENQARMIADAMRKQDVAYEFEKVFAMQFVKQMTSGLFEATAEGPLSAPSVMYKSTIHETLSSELAKQELFGFASRIQALWKNHPQE
jgi:Rod binding domain-containing protein